MIIKEHFERPVGDYSIARNTIKCLFKHNLAVNSAPVNIRNCLKLFISIIVHAC